MPLETSLDTDHTDHMSYEIHEASPKGWSIAATRSPNRDQYEVVIYRVYGPGEIQAVTELNEEGATVQTFKEGNELPVIPIAGQLWRMLVNMMRASDKPAPDLSVLKDQLAREQQRVDQVLTTLLKGDRA